MSATDFPVRTLEFDSLGQYQGEYVYNPVVPYKTTPLDGDRFYFMGPQSRVFSDLFRNVIVQREFVKKTDDGSLWYDLDEQGIIQTGLNSFAINDGEVFNNPDGDQQDFNILIRSKDVRFSPTAIRGANNEFFNSNTFIERNVKIDSVTSDKIRIRIGVNFQPNLPYPVFEENASLEAFPPFTLLKWSLQIGNYFVSINGEWTTNEVINISFLNRESSLTLDKTFNTPPVNILGQEVFFRVYAISMTENFNAEVGDDIAAVPTTSLSIGTFIPLADATTTFTGLTIGKISYYQLKEGTLDDPPTFVRPNDYDGSTNKKYWERVWYSNDFGASLDTEETFITEMNIDFLPAGEIPPDEVKDTKVNSLRNYSDLEFPVRMFDLEAEFNNENDIYLNFLRYANLTSTSEWSERNPDLINPDTPRAIQDHLLDFLSNNTVIPKAKVSSSVVLRNSENNPIVNLSPKNILVDVEDEQKMYFLVGVKSMNTKGEYKGDILEIGSRAENPEPGESQMTAFSDGFDDEAFN